MKYKIPNFFLFVIILNIFFMNLLLANYHYNLTVKDALGTPGTDNNEIVIWFENWGW